MTDPVEEADSLSNHYGFVGVGAGMFLLVIIIGVLVAGLNLKRKRRRTNTGIIILAIHVFVICHKVEISLVESYIFLLLFMHSKCK